jgi:hypothetical protein
MWSKLYRDHFIMAFPSYDTTTNAWAPHVDISWCAGAMRNSEFVTFTTRAATEAEAVSYGLDQGVAWIDQRLNDENKPAVEKRGAQIIDALQTLKPRRSRHPALSQIPRTVGPAKTLTFNQFKSVMTKVGLRGSEPSLRKCYAALTKLRKTHHYSWAEIADKVHRFQQFSATTRRPARMAKAAPIPLTQQAWRRFV